MAEEQKNEEQPTVNVFMEWVFPASEEHERSNTWYVLAGIFALGLIAFGVFTMNFLFLVIIALSVTVLYLTSKHGAKESRIVITEDGLAIGNRFYDYKEIKSFYIIYEPPRVKILYFQLKSIINPVVAIPLLDRNPLHVREVLLEYLQEDLTQENEPPIDTISRWLKL